MRPGEQKSDRAPAARPTRPVVCLYVPLLVIVLLGSACQHVPPAPIDPAENASRLVQRSLDDPTVTLSLDRFGLALPIDGRWSVDQLTVAAWTLRTDVAVAYADLEAAQASTRLAGRRPNPSMATTFERVTNAASDERPWVAGASVGLVIETADKRDIRVQRGLAQEDALRWQFAQTLWDARAELAAAMVERVLADRTVTIDDEELRLRRAYLDWIEIRLQFGAATSHDRFLALQAVSGLESQRELDRAALATAVARVAAAVGVIPDSLAEIAPMYPSLDDLPNLGLQDLLAARDAALSNRLDVQRSLAEYLIAEQDLRAALAAQYPDIVVGPGYLRDQADRKITLSLDLPTLVSSRSTAAIESAVAARSAAARRFDDVQARALADISTSYASYEAARAALVSARNAEQEALRTLQVTRQRIEAGAADRGELIGAEIDLTVRMRNSLATLRTLAEAVASLQNGIQRPLYPPTVIEIPVSAEALR